MHFTKKDAVPQPDMMRVHRRKRPPGMKERERRGGLYRTGRSGWLPRPVSLLGETARMLCAQDGHLRRDQTPDVWGLLHQPARGPRGSLSAAEGSAQQSNGSQALVSGPLHILKKLGDLKGLSLLKVGNTY